MNDLQIKDAIHVQQGVVLFPGYEAIKSAAEEVARVIESTEVTEETIKENKKMLAAARKVKDSLEDQRKAIKNKILEPYMEFETQVKEITGIIDAAESVSRNKVRELEEIERDKKEEELKAIWELRFRPYENAVPFLTFEDFLKPQHLNKTETIKKVEEQMARWLEGCRNDIHVIHNMPDCLEILTEYKSCIDLALSINTVQERKRRAEEIAKVIPKDATEPITMFIVSNAKDAKLAEMLLNENQIAYTKEIK